jgi:predicted AlkP superfamily pyrophosphatase or phosphodiesterase
LICLSVRNIPSKKLKEKVKELDSILENCLASFLANDPATKFIFLGDHGMTEVKNVVDVKIELLK